jgi:hypothetical protein
MRIVAVSKIQYLGCFIGFSKKSELDAQQSGVGQGRMAAGFPCSHALHDIIVFGAKLWWTWIGIQMRHA